MEPLAERRGRGDIGESEGDGRGVSGGKECDGGFRACFVS